MKITRYLALAAWSLAALLAACGPAKVDLTPAPSDKSLDNMPSWMMSPPDEPGYLFSTATATSQDMQMAIDKATIDAQGKLAQQLETRLENLRNRFRDETGQGEDSRLLDLFTGATKASAQQSLVGARIKEQKMVQDKGVYRSYVLMSLPLGEANQVLINQVKTNQELYTRFRATQAFDELEKEMKKLEQK